MVATHCIASGGIRSLIVLDCFDCRIKSMLDMTMIVAEGPETSTHSSAPYAVIAVLAVLLLLVVVVGAIYFAMRKKKKSEHNQSATGDGHVYNAEGPPTPVSAHSWNTFVDEKCEDEFEKHPFVDSDASAVVSTSAKLMYHGGNDDGDMMTAEMVKDSSAF